MAKLVFGMNQSLDGYVDHMGFAPGPTLFRHFIEEAQAQAEVDTGVEGSRLLPAPLEVSDRVRGIAERAGAAERVHRAVQLVDQPEPGP